MVATTLQEPGADEPGVETTADEAVRAYRLLGGRRISQRPIRNALDAHDLIMHGLSSQALLHLVDKVAVLSSGDALKKAIGMSLRTLQRKRKSEQGQAKLSLEQSSRTWRFAEILAQAIEILGSQEAAEAWLLAPAIGLENRRPIDLLSSAAGGEAVEHYLTRMEYGVYT